MMAEDDDEVFVYMGGNQRVPMGVRRARIHKSIKIIPRRAFYNRHDLIDVEFHDEIEIIEEEAFSHCYSMRSAKLLGVRIIKEKAFQFGGLTDVEFSDRLETIGAQAFSYCIDLANMTLPSVRTIGIVAFNHCLRLTELKFSEALEELQTGVFNSCKSLRRIVVPLKGDMIEEQVFHNCVQLVTVDLVGGIHNTVASLHMERWRNEMNEEIHRINEVLPNVTNVTKKTDEIREWMELVSRRLDRYKAEHIRILKEAATLLELAVWKTNLYGNQGGELESDGVRTTRGRRKRARRESCITSGASVVIDNVLPFLELK